MPVAATDMSPERHRYLVIGAAIALLVFMMSVSRDFGFTWDERFQQHYGEQIWDYFHGRIARAAFDTELGNQYLYGGVVEFLSVALQKSVSGDTYVLRHVVTSVFGWAAIVFTGLTAGRLFGIRAGWLAALFLTVSPRFFGDAMNNPKDVPFAALSMATLYFTLTTAPWLFALPWRRVAALIVVIALSLNVRPLGIVLVAYAATGLLGFALLSAIRYPRPDRWAVVTSTALKVAVMTIVAIPLGTVFWPWAQGSPFLRPLEAFRIANRLDWARGFDVLYAGQDLGAGGVPWSYVPQWLFMTLPPIVLVGLVLSWMAWRRGERARAGGLGLVAFTLAPVAAAIVRDATLYDGIRHLEFILAPITVLAAAGWSAALDVRRHSWRLAIAAVLAVGVIEPVSFQLRNHPNQIVYFSPLSGGPRAALAQYDMDYWGNSVLQAVEWAAQEAERSGFPIVVSGNPYQAVEADAARYRSLMAVPRASRAYHFDIRLLRGPSRSVREFAERPDVIYAVRMADGTPLCVIIPGPAYLDISGRLVHAANN